MGDPKSIAYIGKFRSVPPINGGRYCFDINKKGNGYKDYVGKQPLKGMDVLVSPFPLLEENQKFG